MNQASGDYAASVSEFDEAGLTRAPAEAVQVARIGESPVNFECRLIRAIRVADNIVFLGRWFDSMFAMTCSPKAWWTSERSMRLVVWAGGATATRKTSSK